MFGQFLRVIEGLSRSLAVAVPSAMWSFFVVAPHPMIDIHLELLDGFIEDSAKGDLIKLMRRRLMKPCPDAVGLRASRLGFDVINAFQRHIELVSVHQ